jgi:hypothetical protein
MKIFQEKFSIFISHSDIYARFGGTERYQIDHIKSLNAQGINVFQIYPRKKVRLFLFFRRRVYGVNFNDQQIITCCSFRKIKKLFRSALLSKNLQSIFLHHVQSWDLEKILKLLVMSRGVPLIYYAHDMYSVCSSSFLFYNNKEYCGALLPSFSNEKCKTCRYGKRLDRHQYLMAKLLQKTDKVIYPSSVVEMGLVKFFANHLHGKEQQVKEHLNFVYKSTKGIAPVLNRKLNIAYLGSLARHKGEEFFVSLAQDEEMQEHYNLFHIGDGRAIDNVQQIKYSIIKNRNAARDLLLEQQIDMVILWSIVPEAYSYTLHEAFCASVPVLSYKDSGNIACKISSGEIYGRVFESELDARRFLSNRESVAAFIQDNKHHTIWDIQES